MHTEKKSLDIENKEMISRAIKNGRKEKKQYKSIHNSFPLKWFST